MTNLALIKHLIGSNAKLSDERLSIAAELIGLNPSEEYYPTNKCLIYGLAINEIQTDKGVKSISEDGFTIQYSDSSFASSLLSLAKQSGCKELIDQFGNGPKIRNASNLW
ncbi:DUF6706 family protein [Dyadobacter sp. 3J3]|uniref:DUF6706 family protein n=1 Tax=Dyadobacter sp. 3J3 TaxID=2606600 RepID=UPI001358ADCC|nr:DUF6706 family protein [Dyadobacter sp. 3J3]